MKFSRFTGPPLLYAVASTTVGFSIYFSLGVIAGKGLGLTPLILLGAGVMFALTTMSYVEGGAMFRERGGSSTFARHAFNEFISFVAGWAILIDYLIVIAAAAVSVAHYLTPISEEFSGGLPELLVALAVIVSVGVMNVMGVTGRSRQGRLLLIALADLGLQVVVIVVGLVVAFDPSALTAELDLFASPSVNDLVTAAVISTIAFAGIEAASDLAPDLSFEPRDLKRTISVSTILVPLFYAGIAVVALMAVPVKAVPGGTPMTELGTRYAEEPVLGVVRSFEPSALSDGLQWLVVLLAVPVLIWAANVSMLGLSRHVYVLATNRQIPSALGKLHKRKATPYVAIALATLIAIALALPGDIHLLAGIYAFGALLAVAIAHLSIIRLRFSDPKRERPYRVPLNLRIGRDEVPLPAVFAAGVAIAGWCAVIALQDKAFWIGGSWMVVGLVGYVIYRKGIEKTTLTRRVTVPEHALKKEPVKPDLGSVLVPVFGEELDDDIVGTAGRLADSQIEEGESPPRLEVIRVLEVPLSLPIDAELDSDLVEEAEETVRRAVEVAEEYEAVEVSGECVRGRTAGEAIVKRALEGGFEAIVMGAEPPSKIRGGALLGGIGGGRPDEIGPVTEYVLTRAPCRVIVTAPPETIADPPPGELAGNAPHCFVRRCARCVIARSVGVVSEVDVRTNRWMRKDRFVARCGDARGWTRGLVP